MKRKETDNDLNDSFKGKDRFSQSALKPRSNSTIGGRPGSKSVNFSKTQKLNEENKEGDDSLDKMGRTRSIAAIMKS
jgi:hypothetical protein